MCFGAEIEIAIEIDLDTDSDFDFDFDADADWVTGVTRLTKITALFVHGAALRLD